MDYQEIFDFLEKEFQVAFVEELVPGIIHNFANPLNGIMGRSRLLQRKLSEIMKKTDVGSDISSLEDNKKLFSDVESIAREADRMSGMLQYITGKLCAIGDKSIQKINLSELIELEVKFFDFYLEFKHNVRKTVHLDRELPAVKGVPADYSLALSALIKYSMDAMKKSVSKEFYISTQAENGNVCIKIQNQGEPINEEQRKLLLKQLQTDIPSLEGSTEWGLLCALLLLRKCGARFEIERESHVNTISIWIPSFEVKN